ncbi:MAG: efflux RND transporter periplasmic adaptor subunit [Acidobacteria bacterium]|nr:efflux RND transporter periplasmic adaptor subunit [Acidobacteriota bacterium]
MKTGKTILIVLLLAAAYLGGYGYGRWYARGRAPAAPANSGGRRILYYVDPMHPAYKSDKPGIAPDCGMKLRPVYEGEETGGGAGTAQAEHTNAMPPGTVQISPEKQQLIGVSYGTAELASGTRTIRAVGRVAYDETRIARVHSRVEGWIDLVFVDFTGELVEKGRPLLSLYSPEMLATEQEYLLALKSREIMTHSTIPEMAGYSDSLLQAARKRLELWDLSREQIDEITRRGKPLENIVIYAPVSGYVVARNAFPKQRIMPETELYTLVDLRKVWVMADVFEYEAAEIRIGQAAAILFSYYPGRSFPGRVNYIQPQVDPTTRTLKVRLELENPNNVLKPEMFADVEFRIGAGARLSVPVEAILDSGRTKTVFVDRGNGYLEPRHVETGERFGGRIEILSGLKAGERIVISGNFLIDSESQLKAAASGMAHQH